MNPRVEELTTVLAAQRDGLRTLVSLLEEQEAALTRADAPGVSALMIRQDPVLRGLLRLEQRRQGLLKALAPDLGLDPERPLLSALAARVPAASAALTALGTELRRLLETLDVRNRRNAVMLERAVACIEGLVRAVMSVGHEPSPVYAASGRPARPGPPARLVDRSA
jgi:flagellar biosynthesis/type III secretory pathway chaperone